MTTIHCNFNTESKVIELGGDINSPSFRPNMNFLAGPAVDIVADLNYSFPVESEAYDAVFGSYVIEHIRHARLRNFLSECYRILKSNGRVMMITANLLEQCKRMVREPVWTDELIQMIFGGNPDYVGNYHQTGFSPEYAMRLFAEAGFESVTIAPHPVSATDMIVYAEKISRAA